MVWAKAFKQLMHYARISRKAASGKGTRGTKLARPIRTRFQRCAVRVSYSPNTTPGQWRAQAATSHARVPPLFDQHAGTNQPGNQTADTRYSDLPLFGVKYFFRLATTIFPVSSRGLLPEQTALTWVGL
jgi:hypothetical protein